ncbi:uncharacterized protein F4812DRAFT_206386 [Daldinia caldariorum]|uniref:uncharacterized protein n=1 Tax=Daldinia caldariorum TaxID=326644 RepID=UPI002007A01B|nr:uncharacterized protein F4812DRAFT_206386 [Daldinia caldariorum]KAI1464298.1 hypothetical protein F4812DRAFT_206386 [Daldinia caldariorum]
MGSKRKRKKRVGIYFQETGKRGESFQLEATRRGRRTGGRRQAINKLNKSSEDSSLRVCIRGGRGRGEGKGETLVKENTFSIYLCSKRKITTTSYLTYYPQKKRDGLVGWNREAQSNLHACNGRLSKRLRCYLLHAPVLSMPCWLLAVEFNYV